MPANVVPAPPLPTTPGMSVAKFMHIAADQRQIHDLLFRKHLADGRRNCRQQLVRGHGHFHCLRDRTDLQGEVLPDLLGSSECQPECLSLKTR